MVKKVKSKKARPMATGDASDVPKKSRKQRIIEELAFIEGEMKEWGQETHGQIEADLEEYKKYRADRDRIVGKAIRAGLTEHRFVKAWLAEQRTFGEKDALRRFRCGLERGVKRMMSKADFYVTFHGASLLREGMGPEQIRVRLRRNLKSKPEEWFDMENTEVERLRNRLSSMSRQGFHKWLKRLGLIEIE